jgi:hypothetical protein
MLLGLALIQSSLGPFLTIANVRPDLVLLARLGYGLIFGGYLTIPLTLTFPLSLAYYLTYTLLLNVLSQPLPWLPALSNVILPASVLNIAAMLLLFPLLRLLHRRTGREEISW